MSTFVKKVTSAVAGLAIVFSIVTPIAGVSAAFSGLEAANKLSTLAIIEDHSANPADYRLGDFSSREELSKVISKLAGLTADSDDSIYQDTDFASWSEKYAKALNVAGIAASNTYFNPKDMTSKIEALKWVMEARDIETGTGTDWMEARVNGAVAAGIASSFSDYTAEATRGQVFIWAAEAIDADVVVTVDPLCELLGICEETPVDPVEPTTPVVEGSATISLSPESPSNGLAAVNTPRVAMLAFDVTAGETDVTLEQITLYHVGLGDRTNVDNVTVYNSTNESVSKTKNFNDNDLDISFDRDVVVQAGETQTFTIAATITDNGATNTTYQIELTALEASVSVSGAGIVGAALTPTVVSNSAELSVDDDTASNDVTIGEEVTLAGFSIEENKDNEDVLIKTITLHQNGSIDAEYIEDIVLEADGVVIASGLEVNSDDELVMNIDYVLAADDEVEFELIATISGDVGETVHFEFEGADDVYATGISTGFNIGFTSASKTPGDSNINVANSETVEGAEIDAVFDKSDVDETRVDVDDILVGTLELTANSNDYEVTKIEVTVSSTAAIADLYLDGQSYDDLTGLVYTFEDIVLTQGVTEVLPLEFDVTNSGALNGTSVSFTIKVTEIEDDENNITYTISGSDKVKDVLSTNAFDTQTIDIETASFELSQTAVNSRELVLANGVETVLYKAKISIGDSDDVSIEDFNLVPTTATTAALLAASLDLDDIIDSATLNIGGTTYSADVDSNSVDFDPSHVIAAGSDNVEVLITAILQDDSAFSGTLVIELELDTANLQLEDSENDDVLNVTTTTGAKNAVTTLRENGKFTFSVEDDADSNDDLENTVLAGESSVVLAEIEYEVEYEGMDVEELIFIISGDFSDTLENVALMDGSTVIADGAVVTASGANTLIKFEDFVIEDTDSVVNAVLVADLVTFTDEGDSTSATLGSINVVLSSIIVEGDDSGDVITTDISGTVTGETVTIVPVIITASDVDDLGTNDKYALVGFVVDFGSNDLDYNDIFLTQITFEALSGSGVIVRNDADETLSGSIVGNVFTVDLSTPALRNLAEVHNGDNFEFKVSADNEELRVVKNGFQFFVDLDDDGTTANADSLTEIFESSNDNVLDFGEYNED